MNQSIVFLTLLIALFLFASGRIRHDFVALIALFIVTVTGIVPGSEAFSGFGHPAVITVAAVLIIGKALESSGVVDFLGEAVSKTGNNFSVQMISLCFITAAASAFMNNVGALAIMMPVAIHLSRKSGNSPSLILMPLAFASLLGGMTTMIGTPPNIIIATIRADTVGEPFGMFDFTPVGIFIAMAGILFVTFLGWRFLPERAGEKSKEDLFKIDDYITEVRVLRESKLRGETIKNIKKITETDINVLGIVRNKRRIHAPSPSEEMKLNDILIIETDAKDLKTFIEKSGAKLVGGKQFRKDAKGSKDIEIAEAVVMSDSPLLGETAVTTSMRSRYGINLLAVARKEKRIRRRLDHVIFSNGDVVLLQGRSHMLNDTIKSMKFLPLAKRGLRIGYQKKLIPALSIFGLSIITVVAGLLPVQVAFSIAAVTMVLSGILHIKEVYTSVDWPVIVLLGAMIPVGQALETTGGAALIASQILKIGGLMPPWFVLTIILVATMFISDIINNAATVVLMAPIAISVAAGINVSADAFLMAVAVGGSCAFLTPIGHQSNTLVMGPGGYAFTDYWRMGLPLEILIVILSIPLLMFFWPL